MNLFANDLKLPDFWEVVMYYDKAEVHAGDEKKAEITYSLPKDEHGIDCVRWMMPDGHVYQIDYYDVYGCRYQSDLMEPENRIECRVVYAPDQTVLRTYQPEREIFTGWNHGSLVGIDQQLPPGMGRSGRDILILTHTDQVENIEYLVKALPECHFHIAALTAMSQKLLVLKKLGNVSLYQGVSPEKRQELFEICSYYLDINHYIEICDAVSEAYLHDLLILAFDTTLHHKELTLENGVFASDKAAEMADTIKRAMKSREELIWQLRLQRIRGSVHMPEGRKK